MARFQDKVVLISGGARGQGAAEARLLVAEGAKVVIGDVLEAEGRRLADELGRARSSSATTSPRRPIGRRRSRRRRHLAVCMAW
ncbi:MAG: SDR family NAD(P)-dependent oxidoreductase [Acetobacteraceae bacterium]|jgi:NAD(P)-dependent dehydrogenase (short-subunit alcohol dehydrogenase family)